MSEKILNVFSVGLKEDLEFHHVLFHHQHKVDNVFISSCILHNMNLVHDEFDIARKDHLNWETPDDEDDRNLREGRERLRMHGRLVKENEVIENRVLNERNVVLENADDSVDSTYFEFRKQLTVHYMYCFNNNLVEWI